MVTATAILLFVVYASSIAAADESLLPIREIIQSHERLKNAVAEVEGTIETNRIEKDDLHELKPFIRGSFQRGRESFRGTFEAWDPKSITSDFGRSGVRQLVAIDKQSTYQLLVQAPDIKRGFLYVRDIDDPEVNVSIVTHFSSKIDALWSVGDRPLTDILQQPNLSVVSVSRDALVIEVKDGDASARYTLDPLRDYACRKAVVKTDFGVGVEIEIDLDAGPVGSFVPSEVITKGVLPEGGYREKTALAFRTPTNKLPSTFSHDSFKDFGLDYSVSVNGGLPEGAFFGADWTTASIPSRRGSFYFWLVGMMLAAGGFFVVYRTFRMRKYRNV